MSAFTILQIMKMLKNPHVTFAQVADAMNLSSTTVIRIFEKYAGINTIPLPESLCIDEIYSTKYKQKVYACVMAEMRRYVLTTSMSSSSLSVPSHLPGSV